MLPFLRRLRTADKPLILRSCWRSAKPPRKANPSLRRSLEAAYHWICAAQDATPDDGVSALYDLFQGWAPSYPETTGYIIPTFLTYASAVPEPEAGDRAIRMADWEIDVQLPTGAVRSGTLSEKVGPAVFNTGQVLFGWVAAYQATKDQRYAHAAQRAAQWLLEVQDEDGAWRRDLSLLTRSKIQTYNVRTAWGLALAGRLFDEPRWVEAACRNADWALKQQHKNGWFEHNTFFDGDMPLLHTIAYTLEGFLGIGMLLNKEEYITAAQLGVQPLVRLYEKFGKLGGRYTPDWHACVSWRCLTGEAQLALVLQRLRKYHDNDNSTSQVAIHILQDLAKVQDTATSRPEVYGGLPGSEPIWGGYGPFAYLNWAVKFHLDALLLAIFDADVQVSAYPTGLSGQGTSRTGHASAGTLSIGDLTLRIDSEPRDQFAKGRSDAD